MLKLIKHTSVTCFAKIVYFLTPFFSNCFATAVAKVKQNCIQIIPSKPGIDSVNKQLNLFTKKLPKSLITNGDLFHNENRQAFSKDMRCTDF